MPETKSMNPSSVKGRDKTYDGEAVGPQAECVEVVARFLCERDHDGPVDQTRPVCRGHKDEASVLISLLDGGLKQKLDEMRLHEDTGDPIDVGYMRALAELYEWLGIGVEDA